MCVKVSCVAHNSLGIYAYKYCNCVKCFFSKRCFFLCQTKPGNQFIVSFYSIWTRNLNWVLVYVSECKWFCLFLFVKLQQQSLKNTKKKRRNKSPIYRLQLDTAIAKTKIHRSRQETKINWRKMISSTRLILNCALHIWILLNVNVCYSFYLPGLAPVNYCRESESSPQCKVSVKNIFFCLNVPRKKSEAIVKMKR